MPSELRVAEDMGSSSVQVNLISGMLEGLEITVTAATDDGSATTGNITVCTVCAI